ncbi:acyltransferase family protein [Aurantiacibacter luteus]|uniref:Acyltransferase 3 domain-containing protein n=1 Tax=Aurantiacibacter luteus TaxID=1581420 RepID=A0A0G9MU96_9SPHN|nr:acyltransferase [Aurantiacibacter luteus]KLE34119.1 hypothetical protein AAW00_07490 [Aurantiacibacter luteus]
MAVQSNAFSKASTPNRGRIDWLDGWRTIALLFVIVEHWYLLYHPEQSLYGKAGVFIFFSISGYIVTRLLIREKSRQGTVDFRAFYIRRAARILPPLLMYLGGCLIVLGWDNDLVAKLARAALFTCNIKLGASDCTWIVGHTWSLGFEEQFYLILPFAFASFAAKRTWLLLLPALTLALLPVLFPLHWIGMVGWVQIYMLLGGGALLAWHEERLIPFLERIPWYVALSSLALGIAMTRVPVGIAQKLTLPIVPLTILIGVFALPSASDRARRFLAWKPMATLGLYSYTLYLWQQLVLMDGMFVLWWSQTLALLAALAFSAFSFRFIETPFRDLGRRLSGPRASAQPAT